LRIDKFLGFSYNRMTKHQS